MIANALEAWKALGVDVEDDERERPRRPAPGKQSLTARLMPRMMLGGASMVQRAGGRADAAATSETTAPHDDPFAVHLLPRGTAATVAGPRDALEHATLADGSAQAGPIGDALGVPEAPVSSGPSTRAVLGDLGVRGAAGGGRAWVADGDPHVLAHELAHLVHGVNESAADAAADAVLSGRAPRAGTRAMAAAHTAFYGGKVTGGAILRSSPQPGKDNVIGAIPEGAGIEVLIEKDEWAQITHDGRSGWLQKSFVKKNDPGEKAAPSKPGGLGAQKGEPINAPLQAATFLGYKIRAHPVMKRRLAAGEQILAGDTGKQGPELAKELKVTEAHKHIKDAKSYHSYGLALDIEYKRNPYVGGDPTGSDSHASLAAIWRAVWLTGQGGALSPRTSAQMAKQPHATADLYDHFQGGSSALEAYLGAKDDAAQVQKWIDAGHLGRNPAAPPGINAGLLRRDALAGADAATWLAQIKKDFAATRNGNWRMSNNKPRDVLGFQNLDKRLVVALRDGAGMAWGAADIPGGRSGDFQHFDCRFDYPELQTPKGKADAPPPPK